MAPTPLAHRSGGFRGQGRRLLKAELEDAPVKWTKLKRFVFRVPHRKNYPEEFAEHARRTGTKPEIGR